MNKLNMKTKNNIYLDYIENLFPETITYVNDKKVIDFDILKNSLGYFAVDNIKEKYQLTWPGKRESILKLYNLHLTH